MNDPAADPRAAIERAIGPYLVRGRRYHSPLPPELHRWYAYTVDGGHSIVCRLRGHMTDDPFSDLIPVPVQSVLRGYTVEGGYVVVDLPYDPDLGLITPEEDDEF